MSEEDEYHYRVEHQYAGENSFEISSRTYDVSLSECLEIISECNAGATKRDPHCFISRMPKDPYWKKLTVAPLDATLEV
jgi:hypothetical protein